MKEKEKGNEKMKSLDDGFTTSVYVWKKINKRSILNSVAINARIIFLSYFRLYSCATISLSPIADVYGNNIRHITIAHEPRNGCCREIWI
jgi:hypothetical protein